jgi:crotonobetainyl-CoA:carnitine CoA-transferase CaiB-like acyl-CoA transferase
VSLLDSVTALLTYQAQRYLATGEAPVRTGNRHTAIAPYDTFETAEGVVVLAVGNDDQWQRFCAASGRADLAADARFATNELRVRHYDALHPELNRTLAARAASEWVTRLRGAGIPCGSVRSIEDVFNDPQIIAREMLVNVDHPSIGSLSVTGIPVKLSETPGAIRRPPPRLGEHTQQVLEEFGITS